MNETVFLLQLGLAFLAALAFLTAVGSFLPSIILIAYMFFRYRHRNHAKEMRTWAGARMKLAFFRFRKNIWGTKRDPEAIQAAQEAERQAFANLRAAIGETYGRYGKRRPTPREAQAYASVSAKGDGPVPEQAGKSNEDDAPESSKKAKEFGALLGAQLVALHAETGDRRFRGEFDRRLEEAGIPEQAKRDAVYDYTLGIIKAQKKQERLCDPFFSQKGVFNHFKPTLKETPEYYLENEIFTPSEVMQIFDEAEYRYWNHHEQEMGEGVWEEIFRYSRYGGAKLMVGTMERLNQLGLSTEQATAMLRDDQLTVGFLRWTDGFIRPEDVGATREEWAARATVCSRANSVFAFREDGTAALVKWKGNARMVAVPATLEGYRVTEIAEFAFLNVDRLNSVYLEEGLEEIGRAAFSNSRKNRIAINLPRSLKRLRGNPFRDALIELLIPEDHPRFVLLNGVLFDKVDRALIAFPFKEGEYGSLIYMRKPEAYTVPPGTRAIGDNAFWEAKSLDEILLPESLTAIGRYAFGGCENLSRLTLPKGLESIGDSAFLNCNRLNDLALPRGLWEIGVHPCLQTGIQLSFPEGNRRFEVRDGALLDLEAGRLIYGPRDKNLREYKVPDPVRHIGPDAFRYEESLERITFPDGLESIGDYAFYACGSLTRIALPPGLRSIGRQAFSGCGALLEILPPKTPGSLESIGDYAFDRCGSLASLALPEPLSHLGQHAFENCTNLERASLPESLEHLESHVFYKCGALREVCLPSGLKSIGDSAFSACMSLHELILPEGLLKIGSLAFPTQGGFKALHLPASLRELGIFMPPSADFRLTISENNPAFLIEDGLLYNRERALLITCLERNAPLHVSLPDWVREVLEFAFYKCSNLISVKLGPEIKTIQRSAFSDCAGLRRIELQEGLERIELWAFYDCEGLETLAIPASVTFINNSAFSSDHPPLLIVEPGSYAEAFAKENRLKFRYPGPDAGA